MATREWCYKRSRTARMEESEGAARFYDLVYDAPRPEEKAEQARARTETRREALRQLQQQRATRRGARE